MDSAGDTGKTNMDLEIQDVAKEDTGHTGAVHQGGRFRDLYNVGYVQGSVSNISSLNHDPFTSWNVRTPGPQRDSVSDLRLFAAISILFNPAFGVAALIKSVKAREELEKGNIERAKELNSIALGLAIGGFAISFFMGVVIVAQHMIVMKAPA